MNDIHNNLEWLELYRASVKCLRLFFDRELEAYQQLKQTEKSIADIGNQLKELEKNEKVIDREKQEYAAMDELVIMLGVKPTFKDITKEKRIENDAKKDECLKTKAEFERKNAKAEAFLEKADIPKAHLVKFFDLAENNINSAGQAARLLKNSNVSMGSFDERSMMAAIYALEKYAHNNNSFEPVILGFALEMDAALKNLAKDTKTKDASLLNDLGAAIVEVALACEYAQNPNNFDWSAGNIARAVKILKKNRRELTDYNLVQEMETIRRPNYNVRSAGGQTPASNYNVRSAGGQTSASKNNKAKKAGLNIKRIVAVAILAAGVLLAGGAVFNMIGGHGLNQVMEKTGIGSGQNASNGNTADVDISDGKIRVSIPGASKPLELDENTTDEDIQKAIENYIIKTYQKAEPSASATDAADFTYEVRKNNKDEYIEIISYDGTDEYVNIPITIDGLPVCRIGSGAFRENIYLKEVVIPLSVFDIGSSAFNSIETLEKVSVGGLVLNYGDDCFSGCANLKEIVVTGEDEQEIAGPIIVPRVIGAAAFMDCKSLKFIGLNGAVFAENHVERYAFAGCSSLEAAVLPKNVKYIQDNCFIDDTSLTALAYSDEPVDRAALVGNRNAVVIDAVTIWSYAFRNCTSIENVVLGENCAKIGEGAFTDCSNLKNVTWNENRCEGGNEIGSSAFEGTQLEEVNLPGSYLKVNDYAFIKCTELKDFRWEKSSGNTLEQQICLSAFAECPSLEGVYLPETIDSVISWWDTDWELPIFSNSKVVREAAEKKGVSIEPWE